MPSAIRRRALPLLALLLASVPLLLQLRADAAQSELLRSAGLVAVDEGACAGGYVLEDLSSSACTHGPDDMEPPRPGPASTTEMQRIARAGTPGFSCDGDGSSGRRVHTIYAHPPDRPDRYAAIRGGLEAVVASIQVDFADSTARHGGGDPLVPRFTHTAPDGNGDCTPLVDHVTLPSAADDDSFSATINAMKSLGYDDPSRRYLVLMDSAGLCGIGQYWADDSPDPARNLNNRILEPLFSRVDTRCWGYAETHELVHNLGGVQDSAPNATGFGHCNDDRDRMCYDDGGADAALYVDPNCRTDEDERLLDCNGDDYFHPSPARGSYLDGHWNVADSAWLFTPVTAPAPATDGGGADGTGDEGTTTATPDVAPEVTVTDASLDESRDVLSLTGSSSAGSSAVSEVRVSESGSRRGTTVPGSTGSWAVEVAVDDSTSSVRVDAVDADGRTSEPVTVSLDGFRAGNGGSWTDVDPVGSVHGGSIEELTGDGVVDGCTGTRYCPERSLDRRDMARFLARALDLDEVAADFSDVAAGDPDSGFIGAVVEAGIASGVGGGRFDPDGTVTRGQMARFLVNAFDLPAATPDFRDVPRSSVFHDDIGALVAADVTSGCGDGSRYCGTDDVTRGQIATFLVRAR